MCRDSPPGRRARLGDPGVTRCRRTGRALHPARWACRVPLPGSPPEQRARGRRLLYAASPSEGRPARAGRLFRTRVRTAVPPATAHPGFIDTRRMVSPASLCGVCRRFPVASTVELFRRRSQCAPGGGSVNPQRRGRDLSQVRSAAVDGRLDARVTPAHPPTRVRPGEQPPQRPGLALDGHDGRPAAVGARVRVGRRHRPILRPSTPAGSSGDRHPL